MTIRLHSGGLVGAPPTPNFDKQCSFRERPGHRCSSAVGHPTALPAARCWVSRLKYCANRCARGAPSLLRQFTVSSARYKSHGCDLAKVLRYIQRMMRRCVTRQGLRGTLAATWGAHIPQTSSAPVTTSSPAVLAGRTGFLKCFAVVLKCTCLIRASGPRAPGQTCALAVPVASIAEV